MLLDQVAEPVGPDGRGTLATLAPPFPRLCAPPVTRLARVLRLAIRLRSAGGLTRLGTRSREPLPATIRSPCHAPRESCINLPACMSGAPWIIVLRAMRV